MYPILEEKYEKAFEQSASLSTVFPAAAKQQMADMVVNIAKDDRFLARILATNQSDQIKGGFAAEVFHSNTFNLDAIYKGDSTRAITDHDPEWYNTQWNGDTLGKNDIPDIALVKDGKVTTTVQSKFNSSPESTAREMSQPKYEKIDVLLGPEDQVNPNGDVVSVGEHAKAKADALKDTGGTPEEIKAWENTAKKNTGRVSNGKSSSSTLTKEEANKLGSGDNSKLKEIQNAYKTKSTLKQMGNAAIGAAAMSAVVSGSLNTIRYLQLAREGKITREEATLKIIGETVASAADSAVKASANTGVQSLIVRYGSEKAAVEIMAKQGLKSMMKTNAVTVGVVCAVEAVKDLVKLGMGEITKEQFFDRQGKGVLMTTAGVVGGSLGTAAATGIATVLGVASESTAMTVLSAVGGLSGGIIAGLAMTIAIENGIERPYQDLVRNTSFMQEAAAELERVSRTALGLQIIFMRFIEQDHALEKQLQQQFARIDDAGKKAMDVINQI